MADACHSPSFLKKITELSMHNFSLPSSFVKAHGKLLRSDVILEGPSRKQWEVVVDGESSNVTFGKGWEEFVIAHVLQRGDQLCFTLTANSHFQVEVYDESGCQKTSALDATGSNASTPSFPRRLSELQTPPPVSESNSAATRLSQIQNLEDPTLKNESLAIYNNGASESALSDIQLRSAVASALRLRRESALESNRRDSTRGRGSALRDPYVIPPTDGSSALLTNNTPSNTWVPPSFPRRSSALQIPKSDATSTRRQSQIENLDDPTLKVANFSMYTQSTGENPLSDFQLGSSPLLLRRGSALESIRRDSARKDTAVRDPYVLLPTRTDAGLVPDSLLDLADCFVDIEKILSERPDLTDTEPLVIEDIPPCWELHEDTPTLASSTSLLETTTTKRVSTLFSSRPPDLQIPSVSKIETHETTASLAPHQSQFEQKTPRRVSSRPSALQIPPVELESEKSQQTPSTSTQTAMRLSQIQNLDDPTLKAENLALYTKVAAEKALSELQLESATGSPLTGSPLSRRESSVFKAQ